MIEAFLIYAIGIVVFWGLGLAIDWNKDEEISSKGIIGALIFGILWPPIVIAALVLLPLKVRPKDKK